MDLEQALDHARRVGLTDQEMAAAVGQAAADLQARQRAVGVTLTHPDLPGQPITVPEDVVAGHEDSGWVRYVDGDTQPELEPPPALVDVELPEPEKQTAEEA